MASDGERWTREALSALREAHFAPDAVVTFLRDSHARAAQARTRRPALARQARRWTLAGGLGTFALRATLVEQRRPAPSLQALSGWVALEGLMLDWHLGMVQGIHGEPRRRLCLADALTLTRFALTPFVRTAAPCRGWFVVLLALGGSSDLLDGVLARRGGETRFGRDFDSLADSAFRFAALRGARRAGWIGRAAHDALLARQARIAADGAWQWFVHSRRPTDAVSTTARWHVPLLLAGLAAGAGGHPGAANAMLAAASALAGAHARAPATDGTVPPAFCTVPPAFWERVSGAYPRQHRLERASLRAAIELLAPQPAESLLDVGTGTGEALRLLAQRPDRPRRVRGIDLSRAMLGRVAPLPPGWSVTVGDARATGLADGVVEIASACYLLHVLSPSDRRAVLSELHRVLRPGGRVVTVTPAIPARGVARTLAVACDRLAARYAQSFAGLRALDPRNELELAGFEVAAARFNTRGYIAICVLARRPAEAAAPAGSEPDV